MSRKFVFGVLLSLSLPLSADTFVWRGNGGTVDWSNASGWSNMTSRATGVLPGTSDTVTFSASGTNANFVVTPPADFTGTISALGNSTSDKSGLDGSYFPARVEITNANNASFTIGGTGVLVAYSGIETMLDPSFASVIDIPADVTLAPPAGFAPGARFMGVGVLKPSTSAQLDAAQGFRGTLDLRNLASYAVGRDASLFLGRKVVLGGGTTVDTSCQSTTLAPLDLSASKWTFNTAYPSTAGCVPTMDAAGVLTLPHVAGVQNKTSAFLNRRFRPDESFCIRFKLDIAAATGVCGFGIVMRGGELTDVATGNITTENGSVPTNSHGITTLYYNRDGCRFNLFERLAGQTRFQTWGSYKRYLQGADAGFTLRNGSPLDVVASCQDNILTTTFTQDGSTITFRQDVSKTYGSQGAMFGFVTHENGQTVSAVSLQVKISDFEGWVASEQNGQWSDDGDFSLAESNYHLYLDYLTGTVTNSFRDATALDAQGRLRICEGTLWYGAAVSKTQIQDRRFLLEWKNDLGTMVNGQHTDLGFVKIDSESKIKTWYGDPDKADGSGYGLSNRQYLGNGDPIKFCSSWYQNLFGLTRDWHDATKTTHFTGTVVETKNYKQANTSNTGKWFYDGAGQHTVQFRNSGENVQRTFTLTGQRVETNRRLVVVGHGGNAYICNWMGGIKMSYWNAEYVQAPCLDVVAPANAVTTMSGLGAYAPVARVFLDDAASRVKFTGTVAFGEKLKIVVPDLFLKTVRTEATLVDLSSSTISGDLPTTVTLVDKTGAALDLRGRSLTVTAAGVTLGSPSGFILILR